MKKKHKSEDTDGDTNSCKKKLGSTSWWVLVVLFSVVTLCSSWLVLHWTEIPTKHNGYIWWYDTSTESDGRHITKWVSTESDGRHMTKWLADQGVPKVLYDTPFNLWKSSKWTPRSLEKDSKIAQILSKKGHHNIFHYYANNQPLAKIDQLTLSKPFIEVIYPRRRFFTLLEQPFDEYYYYSSGGVEILGIDPICSPKELEQLTFWTSNEQTLGQVNFWFGMENVTAYTHYDTSYNLHSMSYGRKKFVLFPPDAYSKLKLYPCLHQFYRQTFTSVQDLLTTEMIHRLNGIEIVLRPGEVLYIPPYWFHCVITMETTLSVNVWSQSEVYLTMEEVYSSPLPFEESWGRETLMKTLLYFWKKVAGDLFNLQDKFFFQKIVCERYDPLVEKFTHKKKQSLLFEVSKFCQEPSFNASNVLSQESIEHIRKRVEKVQQLFRTISPLAVREINFGNYMEHTALRVLGLDDVILLPFYFQKCFN